MGWVVGKSYPSRDLEAQVNPLIMCVYIVWQCLLWGVPQLHGKYIDSGTDMRFAKSHLFLKEINQKWFYFAFFGERLTVKKQRRPSFDFARGPLVEEAR